MAPSDLLLQIPPATSPLLTPTDRLRQRNGSPERFLIRSDHDVLDDMQFLAPGNWDEEAGRDDDESDDDSIEDFSLEDGNIVGVPSSTMKLRAKCVSALLDPC